MTTGRADSEHLSEEEIMRFVVDDLPEDAVAGVDLHLELCEACARRVEDLYEAWDEFPAVAWEADRDGFIASLRRGSSGGHAATPGALSRGIPLADPSDLRAWAAAPGGPGGGSGGRTEDGGLAWDILADGQGNLSIFLSSRLLAEGTRLLLHAGPWRQEVILTRVDPDQVAGRASLPRKDRAALGEGDGLWIEQPPAGPGAGGRS